MTEYRKKQYPVQGKNKFGTYGFVQVDSFRVDAGVHALNETQTARYYKKGDLILGFRAKVTEAFTSLGSATLQLGFTGVRMLSADTALTSIDAIGDLVGPDLTNGAENGPYLLTADDSFDIINTTAAFTAGKLDIDVIYLPAEQGVNLGDDTHEYVSTA